jgi:hypothetical protein
MSTAAAAAAATDPKIDYIKGQADIFSFVLDVLEGMRKNCQERTCGEIVDIIERYVNTPLRVPASAAYHAGVAAAVQHFRGYFIPREDKINCDGVRYIHNAVEERWETYIRDIGNTTTCFSE